MHSYNTTSQNRFTPQLRTPSVLRHWLEDLLSITLVVVVVSALIYAASLHVDRTNKSGREAAHISRDKAGTIPAIYKRRDQGHSIDI